VRNIALANLSDLREIVVAFRCFLLSDEEFLRVFIENDVLAKLLTKAFCNWECELELIRLMRTILPHAAGFLVEMRITFWIVARLTEENQFRKGFRHLISLYADLVYHAPDCCGDPAVVLRFFDIASVRVKSAIVRFLMVDANVAVRPNFVEFAPVLINSHELIPKEDADFYLTAVHRILTEGFERIATDIRQELEDEKEFMDWLEHLAGHRGDQVLARHAQAVVQLLSAESEEWTQGGSLC